jgi:hypothetical protein
MSDLLTPNIDAAGIEMSASKPVPSPLIISIGALSSTPSQPMI